MKTLNLDYTVPRQRSLARLILALRDINTALRFTERILEKVPDVNDALFEPLEHAAIIAYARPFVGARSIPGRYTAFENRTFMQLHEQIITHRHTIIAHSDEAVQIVGIIPVGGKVLWGDGKYEGAIVGGESIERRVIKREMLALFKSLCEFQIDRIKPHIEGEKRFFLSGFVPVARPAGAS